MNITIAVTPSPTQWTVEVRDGRNGPQLPGSPRHLERLTSGAFAFPLPPQSERDAIARAGQPIDADWLAMCASPSVAQTALGAELTKIESRNIGDIRRFGRYLFAALLGPTWPEIEQRSRGQYLQIELACSDPDFARLPWEMMHDGTNFLARREGSSFSRLVVGARPTVRGPALPLRVLFVIGSLLTDPVIQAGTEYLGLVRQFQLAHPIQTHVLVQATTVKLQEVVAWFQPDVVHFICHGRRLGKQAELELRDPTNDKQKKWVTADDLRPSLTWPDPNTKAPLYPQVVVLNACQSGQWGSDRDAAAPLALQLVNDVPVVVGIAGDVVDQACRLFTRRFYGALVEDGDVIRAAAVGRRFGMQHGADPVKTVDWAMPTLFVAETLTGRLVLQWSDEERKWRQCVERYVKPDRYPAFCGRLHLWEWYSLLLADARVQQSSGRLHGSDLQFLVVEAPAKTKNGDHDAAYGLTRLVDEFAAQAARDGHLPCLVKVQAGPESSNTLPKLLQRLETACLEVARQFGLTPPPRLIGPLLAWNKRDPLPDNFPPDVITTYQDYQQDPTHPAVLGVALRCYLEDLLHRARQQRQVPERMRLLLMVDRLQRCDIRVLPEDQAAGDPEQTNIEVLFAELRKAAQDIRVVLTWDKNPDYQVILKQLEGWQRKRATGTELVELNKFDESEALLAYEHFMLHWWRGNQKCPVTYRDPAARQDVVAALAEQVGGFPSELKEATPVLRALLRGFAGKPSVLCEAGDDDILDLIRREKASFP